MKSLQSKFNKIQKKKFLHSDYLCFAEAVTDQKFSRTIIGIWFRKLVPTDDYGLNDANTLITQLHNLSNPPEDTGFGTEIESRAVSDTKDEHYIVSPITNSHMTEKTI